MDPHCIDVDPDPDPAKNIDADPDPDPDPGGGGGQPKMCIPPGKILGTPLTLGNVGVFLSPMSYPFLFESAGSAYFWASRIRILIRIRIRILPFSHKRVEQTEIVLAK